MKKVIRPFTLDFFYNGELYPFYSHYHNKITDSKVSNPDFAQHSFPIDSVVVINDIPPYLSLINDHAEKTFGKIKLLKYKGFLADLSEFNSVEEYLASQHSRNSRSQIRRSIKRLEACFDIRYQIYYGDIEKHEYDLLFDRLRQMIEKRFYQRGDIHLALADWETIEKSTYQQVLDKRASLFVIYDRSKPIDICVNYHLNGIVNNLIRSYDIDYGRFSLGAVDLHKQIQWCFENNYQIFDLSRGEMLYKRQWCNLEYDLDCYVLYPTKSLQARLLALRLAIFYRLKELLKKWKLDVLVKKIKRSLKRKTQTSIEAEEFQLNTEVLEGQSTNRLGLKADFDSPEFDPFRNAVYDFQFKYSESYKDLDFYSSDQTLVIKGKNKSIKITKPDTSENKT